MQDPSRETRWRRKHIRGAGAKTIESLFCKISGVKRLRHIVWNGLAVISSLVCLASIVLWARLNDGHIDRLRIERASWPIVAADSPPLNMTGLPLDQMRHVWPEMHLANGVWVGT